MNIKDFSEIMGNPVPEKEILKRISNNPETLQLYKDLNDDVRRQVLNFFMGTESVPITYDPFFKKIFNPNEHPERLESLIGSLLGQEVHILEVLKQEGNQLTDKGSFVVMDIVIQLSSGAIVNIEMQKVGYAFPGERADCYVSDLIMREFNKLSIESKNTPEKAKKPFRYKDMKPVFLIVLMENSSEPFSKVAPEYIHTKQTYYSSGAKVPSLSNIVYVSLDTFENITHNIDSKSSAWLTFLSTKKPERIIQLINAYPEFMELYTEISRFRTDEREVLSMFSEALKMMDHNTELYMIDEMKKECELKKLELEKVQVEYINTQIKLGSTLEELENTQNELSNAQKELGNTQKELGNTQKELGNTQKELSETKERLNSTEQDLKKVIEILKKNGISIS
ncbi:MAG: PD-(D/E)XK nuclease family transposase [Butyrivibrio sp.]|nr:PD-(D/E)XK nuclease family transposase [Butyrivibrio sp.]